MKTTKRVLAVFMTVLMIVLAVPLGALADLDLSALSLKANAAISYSYYPVSAAEWAKKHCYDYKSVLLGKGYYSKGGDCANFVSQCLYMGGIDMQNIWNTAGWYAHWNTKDIAKEYQGSFIRVDQLYNYLVKQLNASVKNNPSASDLKVGDVLIYAAKSASDKTHSAIVIEINNGTPKIAYHSVDGAKDRVITTDWKINFKGSLIWRVRPAGQPCVNPNPRSIWVYKVKKETALRKSASASASALNYFLYNSEGEYALVTEKSSDGKWGKTYRYGKWGWVKLADFSGGTKYTASKGEHLFGAWVTTKQATCLVDGQQTRTCTRCGYKETKTLKGGHRIDPHATCLDYGVCTVCGLKVENPLGHDWDNGTVTVQPTCLEQGVKTFVCKRDASHTYTEEIPAFGHDYQIADIGNATCITSGMVKYVCSRCGDSYEQLADENNAWTDWTTEELNVPANRVKSKTQYRYQDKSTMTSYNTAESGWTQNGGKWEKKEEGTIVYGVSWPAGFSTSHSLYSTYHKTPKTASETTTDKTTVTTTHKGYLYWHWCRGTYSSGPINRQIYEKKQGEFTSFHAFFSTADYEYQSDPNARQSSQSTVCKDSYWWIKDRVEIKTCSYQTFKKLFNYYKWSEFSEWQDDPVTASDTRIVETRTVYQYDLRALGHDFSVESDKEYMKRDAFLPSEINGSQVTLLESNTCSVTGFTCSRCGAEAPDSTVVQHVFTGTADETLNGETGTVYKEYCKNGCGCYILWDDHYQTDPCSFEQQQIAPTCTTDGYTLSNCTVHGEALKSDYIPALGHEIPENDAGVVTKYPTCTEPGEITHYCVRYDEGVTCDHRVTEVIPALGHVMTYHAATISCTEEGNIAYYSCEQCNKFFADEAGDHQLTEEELIVPATGHNGLDESGNEVWTLEKEAMCGDPGLERMYCQNPWCKFSDEDCEVHLTQHTFMIDERQTYIDPDYYVRSADYAIWNEAEDQWVGTTCLENGVLHWTCRNCEGTESEHGFDSMVDPAPHTPGDWIVVEPISCTHEGVEVQKCTVCGIDLDYRYTECSDHSTSPLEDGFASSADQMELISSVPNVCGTGTVDTYQCTHVWDGQRCNYTVVIGQPADHTLGEWYVVQPATCEESGLEQRDCINNNDYSETREIDPLGHDLVLEKHIAATCTEPGKNRYYCQRTGCGYTVEEDLVEEPALGHDLGGNYNITKKANCLENGEKVLYCCRVNNGTVCNAKLDVKAILARGQDGDHVWGEWHTITESDCITAGAEQRECQNTQETDEYEACDAVETKGSPALGHQLIKTAYKSATCLESGNQAYSTCTVCGKYFSDEGGTREIAEMSWVLPPLGHDWNDWTDNGDGNHIRVCKRDSSHVETEPHTWSEWETVTPATPDADGLEKRICTVCDVAETRPIKKLKSWTVTFVVNDENGDFHYEGKTYIVVGKPVRFTSVDDVINPPAVPTLEGFVGKWQDYTLTENDLVVPAVYTKKADTGESELITKKESNYENGIAEITLDAFAKTNNVRTELGAKPYDIILVVDQSGSMAYVMDEDREPNKDKYGRTHNYGETAADTRNAKLKSVANNFVDMVAATGLDHRIAIVGFGMAGSAVSDIPAYHNTAVLTPGKTQFGLQQNMKAAYQNAFVSVKTQKATVTNAINGIQAKGATAADLGFEMAKGIFANTDSSGRKRLVIFLTDGEPTYTNSFEDDVANRTINYSYLLKNVYDASVYSIAISGKANPDDETQNFNRFLHRTSSNYPFAKFGESGTAAAQKAYYYATTDATELENIFKDVFASTISNTISFDKVTLYDTISKYFTMTVSQEEALRADLKATYGASSEDVVVTRNDDGTTFLSVCVAPKEVFENNKQIGYGVTVTFQVSANSNAVEAGVYDTNTEVAGVLDGNGNQVASFEIPQIRIPQNRVFVTFKAGDEIYEIRDVRADEEIIAPVSSIGTWNIAPGTVVTENGTVFEAVLNPNERLIKWNTGSDSIIQSYKIGQLIYAPEVTVPDGMSFAGWDNAVPHRMQTTNLEFTAVFVPHTHVWKKLRTTGDCESGMTTDYHCACGETKQETTDSTDHTFTAIITRELDKSVVTMTCTVCGTYTEQQIHYQTAYDKQNYDRWGKPNGTTTMPLELTLYNAQNIIIQPDQDKPITVYVPLTDEQKAVKNQLKAYRLEKSNRFEVESEIVGDYMVLKLDHFSYYVISAAETLLTYGETVCALNGHTYTDLVTLPTCTENGYTTHTCQSCGDIYIDSEVPATDHTPGEWIVDKTATCKEAGSKHQVCAVCRGTITTESIAVDKANHASYGTTLKNKVDANCTTKGYTGDAVCNGCGTVIKKGNEVAAIGHTAPNSKGNCDRCGTHLQDVKPKGDCKYCGETHTGPFGWLIKFFHSILALFGFRK